MLVLSIIFSLIEKFDFYFYFLSIFGILYLNIFLTFLIYKLLYCIISDFLCGVED